MEQAAGEYGGGGGNWWLWLLEQPYRVESGHQRLEHARVRLGDVTGSGATGLYYSKAKW